MPQLLLNRHCFAVLLVAPLLAGAVRTDGTNHEMGERESQQTWDGKGKELKGQRLMPNSNPFITVYNRECQANSHGQPDCRPSETGRYMWCKTTTGIWDYCTVDAESTAHGYTCKPEAKDWGISPILGYAWCYIQTNFKKADGVAWDYCRYPETDPSEHYIEEEESFAGDVTQEFRALNDYLQTEMGEMGEDIEQELAMTMPNRPGIQLMAPENRWTPERAPSKGLSQDQDVPSDGVSSDMDTISIPEGDLSSDEELELDLDEDQETVKEELERAGITDDEQQRDFEATMNRLFGQQVIVERRKDIKIRKDIGLKWCSWDEADWLTQDIETAKRQTLEEWRSEEFRTRLLSHVFKDGVQCCTSYNHELLKFTRPERPDEYLQQHQAQPPHPDKTVYFVLGPSAAGKTSIVATLGRLRQSMALKFPAMTFDGGDVREVSDTWKRYAKEGGSWKGQDGGDRVWHPVDHTVPVKTKCLLKDYFDDVAKPYLKPNLRALMFKWIQLYKPPSVLLPETAVPCVSTLVRSFCPVLRMTRKFKELNYTVKFVVVYAPRSQVQTSGTTRALTEGKPYSSSSYALALYAAKQLYKKYRHKYEFIFVNNTYKDHQLPDEMNWAQYKKVVSQAFWGH